MPDTDTRDRVIRLETRLEHVVDMVEKNSDILATIHKAHLRQEGGFSLAKILLGGAKTLSTGSVGAGMMWLIQHFGKFA